MTFRAFSREPGRRSRRGPWALIAGLAAAAIALWLVARMTAEPEAPELERRASIHRAEPSRVTKSRPSTMREPPVARSSPLPSEATPEPEKDENAYDPSVHPHPITQEHQRLFRENGMIGNIDGAILVQDYAAVRRLNTEYRREYPNDDHVLQDAYDMIADCLEHKTEERVARARKFWETRRSSQARRDLRRACLE